jgi:preprotein translocase subunit SecF
MPRSYHRTGTMIMSVLLVVIGVTIVVRTLAAGGGALAVGIILGVLFTLAGAGRLWVAWKTGDE